MAARNRRGCARVFEAVCVVARESWALGWAHDGLHGAIVVGCKAAWVSILRRAHLVPDSIVLFLGVVFVKVYDVYGGLGVQFLLLLCDAVLLQHALPFFRKALR